MRYLFGWLIVIIFLLSAVIQGCKSKKIVMAPEPEKTGNVNAANQDGTTMDYDEAVKRHFDMQSARTKQMMIDTRKKAASRNFGRNREWYDQLFNNSCERSSCMVKVGHEYRTVTKKSSCFIKN